MGLIRILSIISILLSVGCASSSVYSENTDWNREGDDAVLLLQTMVRIDTSDPSKESDLLFRVKNVLDRFGVECRIYESAPGRGNLVARYRGSGKKKAMMIMAHIDVVEADSRMWDSAPFSGEIRDGYLWGRGAIDDKGMAAVGVRVMCLLQKLRPKLDRDVILMLNGDEESGGSFGARYVQTTFPEEVDCAFVLNEGGRIALGVDGKVSRVHLQCSEKIYQDVRFWIPGRSGHSSVPDSPNAIFDLSASLAKLRMFSFPVRITPVVAAYFETIASFPENESFRVLMERVGRGDTEAARRLALDRPYFNALLRTTCVPTKIWGGIRVNVLPPSAEVNLNFRLLPGDDIRAVLEKTAKTMGWSHVPIVRSEDFAKRRSKDISGPLFILDKEEGEVPESPWKHEVVATIRTMVKKRNPAAKVIPIMLTGATDSRFFRAAGVPSYGMYPCPLSGKELKSIHNHNERISVASVKWGVRWLYDLVVELSGSS